MEGAIGRKSYTARSTRAPNNFAGEDMLEAIRLGIC